MNRRINLNADMGESFGAWTMGDDVALLAVVGSANLACGFHAGDPLAMRRSLRLAKAHGVSVGAHPSFPDLQGFGRRRMDMAADELAAALIYQMGALAGLAAAEGTSVRHFKAHGALSNMACADPALATTVVEAVRAYDASLIVLAPACSQLSAAARAAGLAVVDEVFADRAYLDDGQLVPRKQPGAMIHGAEACLQHVLRMLDEQAIVSVSGKRLPVAVGSVCVHGDSPEAVATARALREGLHEAGYQLLALTELIHPGA